jgi:hypothetical protein
VATGGALLACHAPGLAPRSSQPLPAAAGAPALSNAPGSLEHYRIDPQRSEVLILVYRDGPMAALGHNHVLSVHGLAGEIALPVGSDLVRVSWPAAALQLEFPVADVAVDDPALRAQAGADFTGTPDAASVEGTRAHMLGVSLLDATHFARIRLQCGPLHAAGDHWLATLQILVHDQPHEAEAPVAIQALADGLLFTGEFDLTHAQLGLQPYSIALGALRVAETIHVRYRLLAQRSGDSSPRPEQP